jgi:hypothetical protein
MTQIISVCKQHVQEIIFEPMKDEEKNLGYYTTRNFVVYTGHPVLIR